MLDRCETGSHCSESDFDLKVLAPKIESLVKEYKIHYDRKELVSTDDSLADRLFRAGWTLAEEIGLLCIDTEKILKFSNTELKDALASAPRRLALGEGRDARPMVHRKIEDTTPPTVLGGGSRCSCL